MKFVLMHLPGKVTYKEIDEMIETVDKNGDGKISFSEFRYQRKQNINELRRKLGKNYMRRLLSTVIPQTGSKTISPLPTAGRPNVNPG